MGPTSDSNAAIMTSSARNGRRRSLGVVPSMALFGAAVLLLLLLVLLFLLLLVQNIHPGNPSFVFPVGSCERPFSIGSTQHQSTLSGRRVLRSLAFYTVPKPFANSPQQYRALESWRRLRIRPDINLIMSGDSDMTELAAISKHFNANLISEKLDSQGMPMQDALFVTASRSTKADMVVVVNSDIVLFDDFVDALELTLAEFEGSPFLFVGARYDLPSDEELRLQKQQQQQQQNYDQSAMERSTFDDTYFQRLRLLASSKGVLHSYGGVDYFAWVPSGDPYLAAVNGPIPPFTYGRGKADNWIVQQAINNGAQVVDASLAVRAVHFPHSYNLAKLTGAAAEAEAEERMGDFTPDYSTPGAYQNHWSSSTSIMDEAVAFNRHLAYSYGNYTNQQGTIFHAQWAMAMCYSDGQERQCLMRRMSPATTGNDICACQYDAYVPKTLTPIEVRDNKRFCGTVSPMKPGDILSSDAEFEAMVRRRSENNTIIVFGFNSGYSDMLESTVCRMRALEVDHYVVVAFDREAYAFCRRKVLPCVVGYSEDSSVQLASDAATYGSQEFRQLTKVKSRQVLRVLKLGYNVLWSDIDIFWVSNPTAQLAASSRDHEIQIQSNAPETEIPDNGPRRINSGFYFAKSTPNTIAAFERIVAHAAASPYSEQPSFYSILCGDKLEYVQGSDECHNSKIPVKTKFLSRKQYPNGDCAPWSLMTYPDSMPGQVTIVHNNWIAGREAKIQRFKDHGMWMIIEEGGHCIPAANWPPSRRSSSSATSLSFPSARRGTSATTFPTPHPNHAWTEPTDSLVYMVLVIVGLIVVLCLIRSRPFYRRQRW